MSSNSSEKSKKKVDLTYEQYFNSPMHIPHQGIVLLAEILEETLGRDRAYQLIQEKIENYYREATIKSREKNPVKDFKDFQSRWTNVSSPLMQHVLEAEILESTPRKHKMRVTKCLFAEAFRSMGVPELGYIWECNNDFVMTEAGDPRARLQRPTTLMEGHDCCDFTWYWEDDE